MLGTKRINGNDRAIIITKQSNLEYNRRNRDERFSFFFFFYLTKSVYGLASSRGFNLRRLEIQPGETKIVYPRGCGSKRRCRGEKRNPDERLERSRLVPMR